MKMRFSGNGASADIVEAKKKFQEIFGDSESAQITVTPASLILLGDHAHYNEGVLISVALNKYSIIVIRRRPDDKIILADVDSNNIIRLSLQETETEHEIKFKNIIQLIKVLRDGKYISHGFECAFSSSIPDCIGLGKLASLEVGFGSALKKIFNITITYIELLGIIRKAESDILGKISNIAHLYTAKFGKENKLFFIDLRTLEYKTIPIRGNNLELVIFDTGVKINNVQNMCNERIEECEVGVKGLRLYIWGIKNLRDVESDFLLRHYHMLPRRIFNRVLYNVKKRMRAENTIKFLKKNSMRDFGKCITESHWELSKDYALSNEISDFIVTQS